MDQGIYTMPASEYHSIRAASNSGLKHLSRSPAHYMEAINNPPEPTSAMILGTAVHAAILEPELFAASYVVLPDERPRKPTSAQINAKKPSAESLAAIDWWNSFNTQHAGKIIIDQETMSQVFAMRDSVLSHPFCSEILSAGQAEQSMFWIDAETEVECKARMDWYDRGAIMDIKITDDASPQAFGRSIEKYRYHCQAAMYLDGVEEITGQEISCFQFVVVEKTAPFAVAVYTLDSDSLDLGRRIYGKDLRTYAWCKAIDSWPAYANYPVEIRLPKWAFYKEQDE